MNIKIDDLRQVDGIGESLIEKIKSHFGDVNISLETVNKVDNKKSFYEDVFKYYCSKDNLVKHKKLTKQMLNAFKIARSRLELDDSDFFNIIDRHSSVVSITAKGDYPVKRRNITELFGQKVYNGNALICSEYLNDGCKYLQHLVKKQKKQRGDWL